MNDPLELINGNIYECLGIEGDCYRVIDETGYDETQEIQGYLYPKRFFEVLEG